MDRTTLGWLGIGALALIWTMVGLAGGGAPLIPGFLAVTLLAAAAFPRVRARVMDAALWTLKGSWLRTAIIVMGALMLIQILPVEMALLAAGDVLAYVEVLAAVSMIAAHARLRPLVQRLRQTFADIPVRLRRAARAIRTPHPPGPRRSKPPEPDPMGWAFA